MCAACGLSGRLGAAKRRILSLADSPDVTVDALLLVLFDVAEGMAKFFIHDLRSGKGYDYRETVKGWERN